MADVEQTLEREVKLGAGRGFQLPELPGERLEPRIFTSTYYDTDDHRLARAGVTLRRRVERGKGVWQVKLPRGVARLELELPGGPAGPPAEVEELLTAYVRRGRLRAIAKLRTRRSGIRVHNGAGPVAEVTLDLVSVLADRRVTTSFREIEAELTGGGEKELRRIVRVLREAGATELDGRPKVFRALGIEAPVPVAAPEPEAPAAEHLQAMLERQYEAILAHDPGTRLAEPEDLHQLRVATRRLRAFLRAARPLLDPEWAEALRSELRWLGQALGPVRDLDVLIERLRDESADFETGERRALRRLFDRLEAERADDRAVLVETLRGERYLDLLDRLEAAVREPRFVESEVGVAEIAAKEFERLGKAVRELDDEPDDDALHQVRIRGKRARYAAELAEGTVGRRASRFIREAKRFQDVLGEHQDAVVWEERVRAVLREVGGESFAFAAGRLVERARQRRRAMREAFPRAWKKLRRAGRKAWA